MKFSIYKSPKAQKGVECTRDVYLEMSNAPSLLKLCNQIANEPDADRRGELKKQLPVVTWQAFFEGRRVAKDAQPSGLFMLDIDHVDNPFELYSKKIASRIDELGIVYVGMTASRKGLRIVAKCLPTLHTIEECQRWLAGNLKVDYDGVCKDWARCSFLVHDSYTYYMDAKAIWEDEPAVGTVYAGGANPVQENAEFEEMLSEVHEPINNKTDSDYDQREGLFGGIYDYHGIPLQQIAKEWLERTGGIPERGERNTRLYKLATRMRYLTDFNAATMLKVIPDCGLSEDERKQLIHSALSANRASDMPKDLLDVIRNLEIRKELENDEEPLPEIITEEKMPPMPPVIRQFVENAPDDFKKAVALCQLPILGALGSKLRSRYLDGKLHSPSFMVSLEAPQASGKSFMTKLVYTELAQMIDHDDAQREKEREYDSRVREMKLLNIKVNKDNKDEVLGSRPQSLIRYVPATMSITKLLMRMNDAKGLHLFSMAEEVDTVTKAFKRGFSSFSDLLRVGFDNGITGQDYASENSFSGNVAIYYNMLNSGTPKAMRRFYPDVEDGLVSRVCFVTLPDQFGKPMPEWKELDVKQKQIVDIGLVRLNEISIVGDEVQPEHVMKIEWLNKDLKRWILAQQSRAVKDGDRTRDIFCRRAAVVGFRAGMLAWFLYGEKNTPTIRMNVMRFAVWVANCMLNQHLLRFNIQNSSSNTNPFEELFKSLNNEFTRDELEKAMYSLNVESPIKQILYKWKLAGLIEEESSGRGKTGKKMGIKFRKL